MTAEEVRFPAPTAAALPGGRRLHVSGTLGTRLAPALLVFAAALATLASSEELVRNPGFELGTYPVPFSHPAAVLGVRMPEHWLMYPSNWGYAETVDDTASAKAGDKCLLISCRAHRTRDSRRGPVIVSTAFGVSPGKRYHVRLWVKGGEPGSQFGTSVLEYSGGRERRYLGYVVPRAPGSLSLSSDWQLYRAMYEVQSADTADAALRISAPTRADIAPICIDEVSVKPWDERRLSERLDPSQLIRERNAFEPMLEHFPGLRATYADDISRIDEDLAALLDALQGEALTVEREFELERLFDRLRADIKRVRYRVAFDRID